MQVLGILAVWAVALPVVVAVGLPVGVMAARSGPAIIRTALWTGFAIVAALVVLIHTWLPLRSTGAVAVVGIVALAGLGWGLLRGRHLLVRHWAFPGWWVIGPALIVVALLAIGSSLTPTHYDFGLYHFGAVRLSAEYAAIPGLANLLPYYGYATAEFPLAGLLTVAGDDGFRALNGLFALGLLADLVLRLSGRSRAAGTPVSAVVTLVCLGPLLVFADLLLASPTSDTTVFVMVVAATAALADALSRRRVTRVDVVVATVPLILATTMRPQLGLMLVATIAVLAALLTRQRQWRATAPALAWVAGVGALLGIATAVRDYVLSGWLVYPLSILPLPVEWRADDPGWLRAITIGIARDPGPGYQDAATGYHWVAGWVARLPSAWETWAIAALLLACLLVALRVGRGVRWRRLALLLLPGALFLLAWFAVLPPTWRLAWGAALGVPAAALGWLLHRAAVRPRTVAAAALAVLVVLGVANALVRYPGKPDRYPEVTTLPLVTDGGITLLVPQGTDQCWSSPLTCTSVADPRLSPLEPGGGIEDGLTVGN